MELILLIVYGLALLFIFCYSLIQLQLTFNYKKAKKLQYEKAQLPEQLPVVTVQLPLYNEQYVAKRLIDAVANFDYPKERFEIQVLDDSKDETIEIVNERVQYWASRGLQIQQLRREERTGFKAGALAYGLKKAKGEFLAIFDADFLPNPDFLKKTIVAFNKEEIGMVQCKWEHLNENHSLLTKLQAFGLNAHFSVEQVGRNTAGHFINFNGTAGVWRKKTIVEAGGWQADTLTEDLDLSYRAQLKGWKFLYYENVGAPAELPPEMNALKTQQFRWNKGAAECTRKNLAKVLKSSDFKWSTKINAIFHLMNSAVFIAVLLIALLSLPSLWIKHHFQEYKLLFQIGSFFILCLPILALFYWESKRGGSFLNRLWYFIKYFPLFLSVSMGMSLHNAAAVTEGYLGKKSPFIRTPKLNLHQSSNSWKNNVYLSKQIPLLTYFELLLAIYFFVGILMAFQLKDFGLLPLHVLLFVGFSYVGCISIFHSVKVARK